MSDILLAILGIYLAIGAYELVAGFIRTKKNDPEKLEKVYKDMENAGMSDIMKAFIVMIMSIGTVLVWPVVIFRGKNNGTL